MRVKYKLGLIILPALLVANQAARAAQAYSSMAVAGSFNGWNTSPNMELVNDDVWQFDATIPGSGFAFKFAADGSWGTNWGKLSAPYTTLPLAMVGDRTGGDISVTNLAGGTTYRFVFDDLSFNYAVFLRNNVLTNMLRNVSFETQGSTAQDAWSWQSGTPTPHGGRWGRAQRYSGTAHSGGYAGAILGQWSPSDPKNSGWWQEIPAEPGLTYEVSAWFYADGAPNTWTASVQELKIEFYAFRYGNLQDARVVSLNDITNGWEQRSVSAVAPIDVGWARLVFNVEDAGTKGALRMDDVELRAFTEKRAENFDDWFGATEDGCHTRGGWTICTGRTTTVDARSAYAARLPNPAGVTSNGNFIMSPRFSAGIGTVSFYYRSASTNDEDPKPVSFNVQYSFDTNTWYTFGSVTNSSTMSYVQFLKYQYIATPCSIRIQHAGGTESLLIDDITVEAPTAVRSTQDFDDWPNAGTNLDCHNSVEWMVCQGTISSNGARSGKAGRAVGSATATNFVRSPWLPGYGETSFWYARGTNGLNPAVLRLQASNDSNTWTTLATISNINSTAYTEFSQFLYESNSAFLRIQNLSPPSLAGAQIILIDEPFNDGNNPPPGWYFKGIGEYSGAGYYGRAPPALKFETNDWLETPFFGPATNVSFWVKGASAGPTSYLKIEQSNATPSEWTLVTNLYNLPSSGTTKMIPLSTNVARLRFSYMKVTGNLALDDMLIHGAPAGAQPPQDLLLDDINIGPPRLYRTQDFNTWPRQSSYADSAFQGWIVKDAIIEDGTKRGFAGNVARMNQTVNNYIQSPFLPEGVGPIQFNYARFSEPGTTYYDILFSTNGTLWVSNATLAVSSSNKTAYGHYFYSPTGAYVRLLHRSDSRQVYLDDITIFAPRPPADVALNAWYEPESPYTGDYVTVWASATPLYGAGDLVLTTYYRIGTSGVFHALPMAISNLIDYATISHILPQPKGTSVQFYVRCDFGGVGAELTSPRYYPPGGWTNPVTYMIPRNEPGKAWINEINYINVFDWDWDNDTNEFVEVCAPAGWDISQWRIDLYVTYSTNTYTYYASYRLPQGSVISNDWNGYGFFVLGDPPVPNRDMILTNIMDEFTPHDQISDGAFPSGVRLVNEGGGIEHSVSYRGPIEGFTRINVEEDNIYWPDPADIQLGGTGAVYGAFAWYTNTVFTPGAINMWQDIGSYLPPSWIKFVSMSLGPVITLKVAGNTSAPPWRITPTYSTNLSAAPPAWVNVTGFNSVTNNGTNTITFSRPATGRAFIYRVNATEP